MRNRAVALSITILLAFTGHEQTWANPRAVIQEPRAILESNEPSAPGHLAVYFVEDNQSPVTRIVTPNSDPNAQPLICDTNMIVDRAKPHFSYTSFTSDCEYLGADRWQIPGSQFVDPKNSFIAAVISGIGNCQVTPSAACVASLEIVKKDGTVLNLSPDRPIHDHYRALPSTYDGETRTGYPGGDSPWIWKAVGDETEYLALGSVLTWYNTPGKKDRRSLNFGIYPVKQTPRVLTRDESACGDGIALGSDFSIYCRLAFLDEERITLRLRIPNDLSGWLSGRLVDPTAYIERFDMDYDEVVISAGPAETIIAGDWVKIDPELDRYFKDSIWWRGYEGSAKTASGNTSWPGALVDIANQSVKIFNDLEGALGSRALANVRTWSISLSTSNLPECSRGKTGVQGLVATNAAVYSSGAPTWDPATQTLAYEVASPSRRADDSGPNIGNYGLSMPETLFRCVYGVERIPEQAAISISYPGTKEPIVATVALRVRNAWVYLSANNFTFSSPVIRVKLLQNSSARDSDNNSKSGRSTLSSKDKKKTIVCVKGTQKKKFQRRTCPAGFKRG